MAGANNTFSCPFCAEEIDVSAPNCPCCGESLSRARLKRCPCCAELIPRKVKDLCPFCESPLPLPAVQEKTCGNTVKTSGFPVVTILLIAICCFIHLSLFLPGWTEPTSVTIFNHGGMTYDSVMYKGEFYRLITSFFLHFSLLHLGGNMYVLFSAGKCVERLFGWWRFAGIYLVSGIGGSVATLMFAENFLCAGASGAVFGVIGAVLGYLLRHHRELPPNERNKLYGSVAWFLVVNTVFALWMNSGSGGMKIGIEAHTGGFITGFLAGLILSSTVCSQDELAGFADDL